jgi:hypothetical protein
VSTVRRKRRDASVVSHIELDNPTHLAFGTGKGDRKNLFITNFGLLSPGTRRASVRR